MLFFNKFNVINEFCKITKHLLYFGRTEVTQLYIKSYWTKNGSPRNFEQDFKQGI